MKAEKLMETAIVTLRRDSTLAEIYGVMNRSRQADFPVVDASLQIIGMVYEESILKVLNNAFHSVDGNVSGFPDAARRAGRTLNVRAEEMMTPDIGWVSTETEIGKIAEVIREKRVRCLPVFGNGRVLGVISERAIFMELLKQGAELKNTRGLDNCESVSKSEFIAERRRHPRKRASFKLAYRPTDAQGSSAPHHARIARCLNLSLGGMLAHVSETANANDVLDLVFEIPLSDMPIRRLARVTRVVPAPEGGLNLGLMFLALSDPEGAALSNYLKSLPD